MSQDIAAFLKELGPFSTLSPSALQGISRMVRVRSFGAGERIIARGAPGDAMYIIREGEVRVPIVDAHGKETFVAKLGRGQFFGEMSLMTGDPRAADVFAATPVSTLVIAKDVFEEIVKRTPSLARFLTQILADRLSEGGLMASKTIGKYQLLGELGRGGMSVVYNAIHTSLNRPVAVKMLNHQLAFDEKFRSSFHQEALVIASLDHENIVTVYDTEQAYATFFIVMEFVRGMALSKMIENSGRIPFEQSRDLLLQMCRALGYAHQHGIVHRDVKPTNVLLTHDSRVKLMDFGIARVQRGEAKPEDEEIVGTAEYMAPEQIQGTGVDRRTDIYALGITAYQMLTGELPYVAANPYDVLLAHVTKPMPSIRAKVPGAPEELYGFVERATEKDPARRFQSLEEAERFLETSTVVGAGSGGFGQREGKVLSIFYPMSEAAHVDKAIATFKQQIAGNQKIRLGVANLTPP
jgi:CRP-like cAMP-binding protein